jgi:hypothetical protein
MNGHPLYIPEEIDFVFIPEFIAPKYLSYFASIEFFFRSEFNCCAYLALKVKSKALEDLQSWGKELLRIKGYLKKWAN